MLGLVRHSRYGAVRWLLVSALIGGLSTMLGGDSIPLIIPIVGIAIAAAGLALGTWKGLIEPKLRVRKLKNPCEVRFVVRGLQHAQLSYVVQDDETHIVDELVVPSRSVVDIEFGYIPRVPLRLEQLVFGCEGDANSKPFVVEAFGRFTSGGEAKPASGEHSSDIHKHWHTIRKVARSVGTHYVITYRVRTQQAGVYPVAIAFLTDEIEGNGRLTIRVEDKPKTRMRCRARGHHFGCSVRPIAVQA